MRVEPGKMNPARTMSLNKMFSPIPCWWYTSGGKQTCAKKMSGKIKIKTNGPQKIIGYKSFVSLNNSQ